MKKWGKFAYVGIAKYLQKYSIIAKFLFHVKIQINLKIS